MAADQVQRRRRRVCGPKVRTGCGTCKVRRVKCDELKPSCQRCLNTGRKCDGYSSDILIANQECRNSLPLIQRISTHMTGNEQEKRGFQYFLQNTAAELSGYYDPSFWERLILAASTREPALRHAVVAIGGLHEAFSQKTIGLSDASKKDDRADFALSQYSKAIGALRRSLSSGKQEPLTALMSCILFVCFDSLRGWFESAMVHLQSGLRILRDMRLRDTIDNLIIEDSIAPLFMRLSIQSVLYVDTRSTEDRRAFARELMVVSAHEIVIPEQFETLEEARRGLYQAADGLFRMFYMCDGNLPLSVQPEETFTLFEKYTMQIYLWNMAFEKFMVAKSRDFNSKQVRGAALLKIHHMTAKIMAGVRPDLNDLTALANAVNTVEAFMKYIDDFHIIINLSRSLITAAEQDAKSGKPALTFSTDLGLVGPLYYTCIKCPIVSMRKTALELIRKCPRKEGMWNSVLVATMVEEYWALEARHRKAQNSGEQLDEFGIAIPLNETVDLIFTDGMKWEWKFKEPSQRRSTFFSPEYLWTELLQHQSLFEDMSTGLDPALPGRSG